MTDLREKLALVIHDCRRDNKTFYETADAIIAALPGMVKPLEWEENRDDDSVVCRAEAMHRYVAGTDTNGDSYLGIGAAGYTEFGKGGLEAAKAFAEEHHRSAAVSAIMAALGVEWE